MLVLDIFEVQLNIGVWEIPPRKSERKEKSRRLRMIPKIQAEEVVCIKRAEVKYQEGMLETRSDVMEDKGIENRKDRIHSI